MNQQFHNKPQSLMVTDKQAGVGVQCAPHLSGQIGLKMKINGF